MAKNKKTKRSIKKRRKTEKRRLFQRVQKNAKTKRAVKPRKNSRLQKTKKIGLTRSRALVKKSFTQSLTKDVSKKQVTIRYSKGRKNPAVRDAILDEGKRLLKKARKKIRTKNKVKVGFYATIRYKGKNGKFKTKTLSAIGDTFDETIDLLSQDDIFSEETYLQYLPDGETITHSPLTKPTLVKLHYAQFFKTTGKNK